MTDPIDYGDDTSVLDLIEEGMTVYDAREEEVGEVEGVYYGVIGEGPAGAATAPATPSGRDVDEESWVEAFIEAFDLDADDLPEVLAERLLRHGFIHIEAGLIFDNNVYIMPEQIAAVTDEGVRLRVARDELIEEG